MPQFDVVNVNDDPPVTDTADVSRDTAATTTLAVGRVASLTVNVSLSPSLTGTLVRLSTRAAVSSSVIDTTAESWVPSLTPAGNVPQRQLAPTRRHHQQNHPTAANAMVFSVSPELNTT